MTQCYGRTSRVVHCLFCFACAAVTVDSSRMTEVLCLCMTVSLSASWTRFSPPSNVVNGHVSTVWFCRWPQSQEGDWVRSGVVVWLGDSVTGGLSWSRVAEHVGTRSEKQCRTKWLNYLNWKQKGGAEWTRDDDLLLITKCDLFLSVHLTPVLPLAAVTLSVSVFVCC